MEVMILAYHRQFFMKHLMINGRETNVELRVKTHFDAITTQMKNLET